MDSNIYLCKRNIYDRVKWPSFTAHAVITNTMIEGNIDKEPDNISLLLLILAIQKHHPHINLSRQVGIVTIK